MSTTITPTPGRIVWYRGADGEVRPAIVIKGNGPFNADLYVFPLNVTDTDWGNKPTVTHADPEQEPGCLQSWHWMPYQKQQAEKAETELARGDEPKTQLSTACGGQIIGASARDAAYLRAQAVEMALRTPGICNHRDVLKAAEVYQAHIDGQAAPSIETKAYADGAKATGPAPLPDASPMPASGLTFGYALVALKAGNRVARAGWNGKGMFAYLVPANSYPAQTGAAKAFFGDGGLVPYNAYLALKGADDTVSTWAPSGSDALAEDWLIVDAPAAASDASGYSQPYYPG
jgi:hypothetical protein